MIPVAAAGSVGLRILRTLYKGKKWIGRRSKTLSAKAGKAGFTKTSQAMSGISKKTHLGTKYLGKKIKKYPKTSAALGGAVAWDILDRDD